MPFADIAIAMDVLGGDAPNTEPDYNIPPTSRVLVCYLHPITKRRIIEKMVWGLIPRWAKDRGGGYSTFNARCETVTTMASFKAPWREGKRCLVITEGFYEWKKSKKNPKNKQPYAIAKANAKLTVLAGLWEQWRDSSSGEIVKSCTVITTRANSLIEPLHDRMPVILREDQWPKWLGEEPAHDQELIDWMMTPYPSDDMKLWPVNKRVGNVKNNDPELLTPVEVDAEFMDEGLRLEELPF
jgi:putative SOS response-associated peptidase YedK